MWLCLNDAFISIVQKNPRDKNTLTIRARRCGDIHRFIPGAKVTEKGGTDYQFRAQVSRKQVADAMVRRLMAVNYSNFKNSVRDNQLHNAYSGVWSVMLRTQEYQPFLPVNRSGNLFEDDDFDFDDEPDEAAGDMLECEECEASNHPSSILCETCGCPLPDLV